MINIHDLTKEIESQGYTKVNAQAKLCQDIVLKMISKSSYNRNVTIKGGVVMRSLSGSKRRTTQDIDIDFIKYCLSKDAIVNFIDKINNLEDIKISIMGTIEELKQQDYHGKRAYIDIRDEYGNVLFSKIDFGVHKNMDIEQEEYCFDIGFDDSGVSLLINSKEQMLTEKLRAILKFGSFSTRHKDIYDIFYLLEFVNKDKLMKCMNIYIYSDKGMVENNISGVIKRIEKIFSDINYIRRLKTSNKNWVGVETEKVLNRIIEFLKEI